MAVILDAKGLNKTFGAVTAASDINVAVEQDSVVGLIGSNGAGKTTFINMVTGYLKPSSGSIHFDGRNITALSPRQITRLGICRSFQIPQLYNTMTVHENLLVGVGIVAAAGNAWGGAHSAAYSDPEKAVDAMLEEFGIGAYRNRDAGLLPEGTRKLLDIAMAMVVRPKILLLDEPTSGVSADEKFSLMDCVMAAVREHKVTVLFVEHDMEVVERYTHRVLAFYEGRIIADGEPAVVLDDVEVRKFVIGDHAPAAASGGGHA
ncbi:MAG: ATP-binding cassette domain-containing protein [Betaproteobacteria bacterium]|nr:ATP-binding cassette domain-containing protein [Betaproteobacteria bacterium]